MQAILRPRTVGIVAVALVLVAFPYLYTWPVFDTFLDPFRTFQATRFAIWLVVLLGLNLLTGYSGQISLGHGALVAVGGYVAAILMSDYGVPLVLAVLAAGLFTGLFGFLLGVPALRLTGPYLAIATLAMMLAFPQILKLNGINDWTGGGGGILLSAPEAPAALDGLVTARQWLYYSCMVPALIMLAMAWNLTRTRIGRAFIALRDTEMGAEQMGINVRLYKMTAFGLSAFYAGIGGALFVYAEAFMSPGTFDVTLSMTMLVVVVLGGLGSIPGTVAAAVIMTARNEIVNAFAATGVLKVPGALFPGREQPPETLQGALYGLMLMLAIVFSPRGFAGFIEDLQRVSPRQAFSQVRSLPSRWVGTLGRARRTDV